MYCLRCNRELGTGHKSVAIYLFAQTVGIKAAAKIRSAAHLLLPAMFRFACHGSTSRRRAQPRRLGNDPGPGRFGSSLESGSMAELERGLRDASAYRHGRSPPFGNVRRILRILRATALPADLPIVPKSRSQLTFYLSLRSKEVSVVGNFVYPNCVLMIRCWAGLRPLA